MMELVPAIDLRGGKVVQLVGGDPDRVGHQGEETPAEQARTWRAAGARRLHVIDLDAALGGTNQWPTVGKIIAQGSPVRFGGGIRSMLDVQKMLDLGADQVIVGTQGVRNPEWVRELATLWPGRIVLAVDARGRDIVVQGWTESTGLDVVDVVASLDDAGLAGFLYTNVEREGRLAGVDLEPIQAVLDAAKQTRVIVSGGIHDARDLEALAAAGVAEVVLGMSIYTGAIAYSDAVTRFGGIHGA